jgi:predicted XRE-type DNA-binding protein
MANYQDIELEKSCGNIFADLEIPDSDEYLAKAKLASKICELINQRNLTQTEAGKLLGVNQPKISALMTGKLDGFSSERLFRFLNALDQEIEIIIKPKKSPNQTPTINVICH